jgi:hypothetical protein
MHDEESAARTIHAACAPLQTMRWPQRHRMHSICTSDGLGEAYLLQPCPTCQHTRPTTQRPLQFHSPSCDVSQLRTVRAFSMVSAVVNVLLITTAMVSSGSSPFSARACRQQQDTQQATAETRKNNTPATHRVHGHRPTPIGSSHAHPNGYTGLHQLQQTAPHSTTRPQPKQPQQQQPLHPPHQWGPRLQGTAGCGRGCRSWPWAQSCTGIVQRQQTAWAGS